MMLCLVPLACTIFFCCLPAECNLSNNKDAKMPPLFVNNQKLTDQLTWSPTSAAARPVPSSVIQWLTGSGNKIRYKGNQEAAYWQKLLGVLDHGHPSVHHISDEIMVKWLPNGPIVTKIEALVAVTTSLNEFNCTERESSCAAFSNSGFDGKTNTFPAANMLDGNYTTVCSIFGSAHDFPWVAIYMPGPTYVKSLKLTLATIPGEMPVNYEDTPIEFAVSLQWLDLVKSCESSTLTNGGLSQSDVSVTVFCGEFLADVVFVQIKEPWKRPVNLTLSEIQVEGILVQRHRLANVLAQINLRQGALINFISTKNSTNMSYKYHVLTMSGNYNSLFQSFRIVEVMYTEADAFVSIEGCEHVWLDKDILFEIPCIKNVEDDKCSWTLAFVDGELNVYLDRQLIGRSFWNFPNCSPGTICETCMKVIDSTDFIWTNKNNWVITALNLNVHLQMKQKITTKLERHDECFAVEMFLRDECADIISMEGFIEFANHTVQYGFELLNVSSILYDEFLDKYSSLVVDNIIFDIGQEIEDSYMLSDEYRDLVQSESFEESESLESYLDVMALKQQNELNKLAKLEILLKKRFIHEISLRDYFIILYEFALNLQINNIVSGSELLNSELGVLEEKINIIYDSNYFIQPDKAPSNDSTTRPTELPQPLVDEELNLLIMQFYWLDFDKFLNASPLKVVSPEKGNIP